MKNYLKVALIALTIILAGCGRDATITDFRNEITLEDFEGTYKNIGESSATGIVVYLSKLIWPEDEMLDHFMVDRVEVIKSGNNSLVVNAYTGEIIIKNGEYVEGKDFVLTNGVIKLGKSPSGVSNLEDTSMLLIGYKNVEIGLDTEGHGRYEQSEYMTGVMMLLIPVVGYDKQDVRFERLK